MDSVRVWQRTEIYFIVNFCFICETKRLKR